MKKKNLIFIILLVSLTACSSPPKPTTVDGKSRISINNSSSIHSILNSI